VEHELKHRAKVPPFGRIEAALRCTTERLAREFSSPQDTAPSWTDFEWQIARAVASMQGITMLLAGHLRWQGPPSWQWFIATQCHQSQQRDTRIAATLIRIEDALRGAGVACVALKGSALRKLHLYRPGDRPMGDIDLLARPDDAVRIEQALRSIDYTAAHRMRRHTVFAPPARGLLTAFGEHPDNPLKVELHEVIAESLPVRSVDITDSLWPVDVAPGLVSYPHARELMRHLLLHAAGNMRGHALRQLQLHDIALLAARLTDHDWQALLETPEARGGSWWMWPVLELTARYYPSVPGAHLLEFRKRCAPWLRAASARNTLTEVSWSNLRIAAFPGLSWARSPREAASFMRSRMFPAREALDELAKAEEIMPVLRAVPWYGRNHLQRVLRWIFSRPPRVQTMCAVLDCLGARPGGRP
jgi:hypothetical protein